MVRIGRPQCGRGLDRPSGCVYRQWRPAIACAPIARWLAFNQLLHTCLVISVSVVIPCYNRAETVAEAIASAFAQTRPALEVLLVDDGSTDASAEIAERAGARVIRLPTNAGNAAARNIGIRAASGDAIASLDSDDYWEPNHLSTVAALLDKYPDAAVASSAIRFFGSKSGTFHSHVPEGPPTDALRAAFYGTAIPLITSVVRRDALLAVNGFDESERCAIDFDLWLRLARRYKFVASRDITVNYRWHANQISASPERQWEATYRFRKRALDEIRSAGEAELTAELSALFRMRWQEDVQSAWDTDSTRWLRRLMELAQMVPGLPRDIKRKWKLRSRIPTPVVAMVSAWNTRRANLGVRRDAAAKPGIDA